ncbi:hypothetical protein EfmE980_2120 [Enterococcus faecium E980]|nr:hypothetical protein EfmE980_2120 [Enterococcus faecium E980]SJX71792.1 hypothetical protein FM130_13790 [Enterococcus faecium]
MLFLYRYQLILSTHLIWQPRWLLEWMLLMKFDHFDLIGTLS